MRDCRWSSHTTSDALSLDEPKRSDKNDGPRFVQVWLEDPRVRESSAKRARLSRLPSPTATTCLRVLQHPRLSLFLHCPSPSCTGRWPGHRASRDSVSLVVNVVLVAKPQHSGSPSDGSACHATGRFWTRVDDESVLPPPPRSGGVKAGRQLGHEWRFPNRLLSVSVPPGGHNHWRSSRGEASAAYPSPSL